MIKLFKVIDSCLLFSYLVIDVIQDEVRICLNKVACANKILETFKMDELNHIHEWKLM